MRISCQTFALIVINYHSSFSSLIGHINTSLLTESLLISNSFVTEVLCKSMDWFMCDKDFHHERVNL